MDKDRAEAKKMAKELPFKEKVKHFWEYYKNHTLLVLFLAVMLIITAVQCAQQIDYDLEISLYTSKGLLQENVDFLEQTIKEQSYDINDNGVVDIGVFQYFADISTPDVYDEKVEAVLSKLQAELSSNRWPAYIVDEYYKEILLKAFPDGVKTSVEISQIPEIKEELKLGDDEKLYFVVLPEYEGKEDGDELVKKYGLAEKLAEYFENLLKK
ncbi:MAG: hypothetical protein IJE62_09000 [Clostridia bacterium]|nr:hypothetical protein [Clostridia bacterium]